MENIINRLNIIDDIVPTADFSRVEDIVNYLKDQSTRTYLFNMVDANFSREWFFILLDLDAFNFNTIPGPKKEDDGAHYSFYGWEASLLIRKAATYSLKNKDKVLAGAVLQLTNKYIDYVHERKDDKTRNFRPDWFFCYCILQFPLELITDRHYAFLVEFGLGPGFGNISHDLMIDFFNRVVGEKNKETLNKLLDIIFSEIRSGKLFDISPRVENYALMEFVNGSAAKLFEVLNVGVIYWLAARIRELNAKYSSAFTKFVIVSIDEDGQNWHSQGLSNLIVKQLRNCLSANQIAVDVLHNLLGEFLNDISILKRISLYKINQDYPKLKNLFWQIKNPLIDSECKLENYKLISNHAAEFEKQEVLKVRDWIEKIQIEPIPGQTSEYAKKSEAYAKSEWYTALDPAQTEFIDQEIKNRKQELDKIAGMAPSHPGYDSWSQFTPGGDFSLKRISGQPIESIPARLNDEELWEGYDQWGLQEDFRRLVADRPQEVLMNIEKFDKIRLNFLYYLFDGYRNILQNAKNLDWNRFFAFAERAVNDREEIWVVNEAGPDDQSASLGMLAWLIKDAANPSNPIFNDFQLYDKMADILITIDQKYSVKFRFLNAEKDQLFDIANSTRGKLYEAMLNLSLTMTKIKRGTPERWNKKIRDVFEKRLRDGSFYEEFYWTTGMFTPQICYLDKAWWQANRDLIYIDKANIKDFAFKAYLFFSPQLYKDIFSELKEKYEIAIDNYKVLNQYGERLAQHILIAFSIGEQNSSMLLEKIFNAKILSYLKYIVDYIDGKFIKPEDDKLLYLWKRIIEICKPIEDNFAKQIIFGTADFVQFVHRIDEDILDLFEEAMEYYSSDPRVHRLTEIALGVIQKDPAMGARMLRTLTNKIEGDYSFGSEIILLSLKLLYEADQHKIANEIVIHMAEQGNFYVKNIYNEFNPPNSN